MYTHCYTNTCTLYMSKGVHIIFWMSLLRTHQHYVYLEPGLQYACTEALALECDRQTIDMNIYTVQLTRNLNASVEYEHFYSRVSMCETRALEHSYSSFTRRSDLEHSSTRALQYFDSTRTSQLDIRIRAIEHRTQRY